MESLILLAMIFTFLILIVPITCVVSGAVTMEFAGFRRDTGVIQLPFDLNYHYHKHEPIRSLVITISIVVGIIVSLLLAFISFWITPVVAIIFLIVRTLLYFFKDRKNAS